MENSEFSILPLPASIRRRLPRLYSFHRAETNATETSRNPQDGSATLSESQLLCHTQNSAVIPEAQRPSTASDDLDFDSSSGRSDSSREEIRSPAKYETESGLRWNRVVPAINLLRNAGYEAQQSQADGRLVRSLYINALVYLLDALPADLTPEETSTLRHHVPEPVKAELMTYTQPPRYLEGAGHRVESHPKSYLHRVLASTIVQLFILLRFILPYARLLLCQVYQYQRTHRITERIMATTLEAADGLGKSSVNIGAAVYKFNDGRVGAALSNFAGWWMEGVAGGIYEGVGEGMLYLSLLGKEADIDGFPLQSM
ncbi:hypothetical protein N7461_006573, partial [Penicillium sp. DV-2018c]